MRNWRLFFVFAAFVLMVSSRGQAGEIRSAGVKGVWSADSTWQGGIVPGANDIAIISDRDTVTLDGGTVTLAGLTIGEALDLTQAARLKFSRTLPIKLTINGDLTIADSAALVLESNQLFGINIVDTMIITGNISSKGKFVLSGGSGSSNTLTFLTTIFTGSGNSTVELSGTAFTATNISNNRWGAVTINKSGAGRVILNSAMLLPGGTSANPDNVNPILRLDRGIIDARNFPVVSYWTVDNNVKGGSDSSYVMGSLGRGISNGSTGIVRLFPIGDEKGYRPIKVRNTTSGTTTGHHVIVGCVGSNANTGTSTFGGGIDKVSSVRYYKVTYSKGWAASAAAQMSFDKFYLTYKATDGVKAGNQNLRVAVSENARAAWAGVGPTIVPHTTILADSLSQFSSDTTSVKTIVAESSIYIALARGSGTTENSLDYTPAGVVQTSAVPTTFGLEQNYPNPFNPATSIRFSVLGSGDVKLSISDVLGREIAVLVNEKKDAGQYEVQWDSSRYPSGTYFYTLTAGDFTQPDE